MEKLNLNQIQNRFWKALVSSEEGSSDRKRLSGFLNESDSLSSSKRMSIYSTAYFLRILGALVEDFVDLQRLLGAKNFEMLAKEYLAQHPSEHFSLKYIGARLPEFIRTTSWDRRHPWAADLAAFEWVKADLFDSPDHATLKREDLAKTPQEAWPDLKFKFIPSLTVLTTQFRVEEVLEKPKLKGPRIPLKLGSLKIWRRDEEIYYSRVNDEEALMIGLVCENKNFETLCEQISMKGIENPAERVFKILSQWIDEQVIERTYC